MEIMESNNNILNSSKIKTPFLRPIKFLIIIIRTKIIKLLKESPKISIIYMICSTQTFKANKYSSTI